MKLKNIADALQSIRNEGAKDAWAYLEREKPDTAEAIQYLADSKWTEDQIMNEITKIYGPTEEKTIHKVRLVVSALVDGTVLE